jgi:hypothetical protein
VADLLRDIALFELAYLNTDLGLYLSVGGGQDGGGYLRRKPDATIFSLREYSDRDRNAVARREHRLAVSPRRRRRAICRRLQKLQFPYAIPARDHPKIYVDTNSAGVHTEFR